MTIEPFPMIFVAGPYGSDPVANTGRACRVGAMLLDAGVAAVVPHTTLAWDLVTPRPERVWLDLDLAVLVRCDGVMRLAGASKGADAEVERARALGLRVFEQGEEEDNAFAARVIEWAVGLRGRPHVTLIIEESGLQRVLVGTEEVWCGMEETYPGNMLIGNLWRFPGVTVQDAPRNDDGDNDYSDCIGEDLVFEGKRVRRWLWADTCYPVDVLEALRDAGAITLRVVGGGA